MKNKFLGFLATVLLFGTGCNDRGGCQTEIPLYVYKNESGADIRMSFHPRNSREESLLLLKNGESREEPNSLFGGDIMGYEGTVTFDGEYTLLFEKDKKAPFDPREPVNYELLETGSLTYYNIYTFTPEMFEAAKKAR